MGIAENIFSAAGFSVLIYLSMRRRIKRLKKEIARDTQRALYQDRQIRQGNVRSIDGSNRSRGSGTSGS